MFVDRSGDLFATILQYLRTLKRPAESIIQKHKEAILEECSYFGIESLAHIVKGETNPSDMLLSDRRIRDNELAATDDPRSCQEDMLLHVHTVDASPLDRSVLELPLLFEDNVQPTLKGGLEDFIQRFNAFSGELLKDLEGVPNLIIAGGSVLGFPPGFDRLSVRFKKLTTFRDSPEHAGLDLTMALSRINLT